MEVYFAPHLATAVVTAVRVGDCITIYGVLPMAEPMIVAAVIGAANGERIVDCGLPMHTSSKPHAQRGSHKRETTVLQVEALVRRTLHGPLGATRGVLLDDGTSVTRPALAGQDLCDLLGPASWLTVRGAGVVTELGTAIRADQIGRSAAALRPLPV